MLSELLFCILHIATKMKNIWYFAFTSFNIIIKNQKPTKTKQCSKQICLQIIVLLDITTNTSIKKMVTSKQKRRQSRPVSQLISVNLVLRHGVLEILRYKDQYNNWYCWRKGRKQRNTKQCNYCCLHKVKYSGTQNCDTQNCVNKKEF